MGSQSSACIHLLDLGCLNGKECSQKGSEGGDASPGLIGFESGNGQQGDGNIVCGLRYDRGARPALNRESDTKGIELTKTNC